MPDTVRGDFPGVRCSDCGLMRCVFEHRGSLVPAGTQGHFCGDCMSERDAGYKAGMLPKILGHKMMGVYTKAVFESLRGMTEVFEEKNFLPPNDVFLSYASGENSWWINESFIVRGRGGLYLVYHGYLPTIHRRYFAVWIYGPHTDTHQIDTVRDISRRGKGSEALFTEVDGNITINFENREGNMGRRFRGLLESETLEGTRVEQVAAAAKVIIS